MILLIVIIVVLSLPAGLLVTFAYDPKSARLLISPILSFLAVILIYLGVWVRNHIPLLRRAPGFLPTGTKTNMLERLANASFPMIPRQ